MGAENPGRFDLFGDPIRETREGPGRPEHVWTPENSQKISLLFAIGYDVKEAAAVVGITQPTLRKHYFSEVEKRKVAKLRLKAALLSRLFIEGEAGNVAATKELFKRIDSAELAFLSEQVSGRGKREVKPKAKGKKEAAIDAAQGVRGKFAPPPAPSLLTPEGNA